MVPVIAIPFLLWYVVCDKKDVQRTGGKKEMPQVKVIPALSEQVKKIRVAAYARVSSDSADQLNSFAIQTEYYTSYIQSQAEWEFAGLYADEAVSGTSTEKREDFQRLLEDCRAGKIDRILVKSISRFARNTLDCIEAVRELKQIGVTILFEKENIDTANLGSEMLLSILSAAAQEESLSISKNLKWSVRKRMKTGEFLTCRAPYGYTLKGNQLEIYPPEAKIVRLIFQWYLSGAGMAEITAELNRQKIPKRYHAERWSIYHIQYILTNEKYVGDSRVQKRYTPDALPFRLQKNTGQLPQYYIENSHPAIVSKKEFQAVRELISRKTCKPVSHTKSVLSRKMVCGLCGSVLKRQSVSNKWICRKHEKRKDLCSLMPVAQAEIDRTFLRLFNNLLEHKAQILNPLIRDLKILEKRGESEDSISRINRQISELMRRQHALARLVTKGSIDSALYVERATEINRELYELHKEAKTCCGENKIREYRRKTENILDLLENSDPLVEFEPDIFQILIEKIEITPEKYFFHLTNGLILKEMR